MTVDTNTLVAMTEANQNFSKVTRLVGEEGLAVILKNNKPKYIVVSFDEYDKIAATRENRRNLIDNATDELISENRNALEKLAN